MDFMKFLPYLIVMAGVTYFIRVLPLVLIKKKIRNRMLNSFLYYIPYTVLAAMTFPAILYATGSILSAAAGFFAAVLLAYKKHSLIVVASGACVSVLAVELLMKFLAL